MLAPGTKWFPAGGKNVHIGSAFADVLRQSGRDCDNVLAVVDDQQNGLSSQHCDDGRNRVVGSDRLPERRCQYGWDECGIGNWRQIQEVNSVTVGSATPTCDGESDGRFADTGGPNDCDQAALRKLSRQGSDRALTAKHLGQESREVVRGIGCGLGLARLRGQARDGSHKTVTPAGRIDDKSSALVPIPQGSAQGHDVDAQRAAFHEYSGPGARQQLLVADNVSRPVDEGRQDIEGSPTKGNASAIFQKEAL